VSGKVRLLLSQGKHFPNYRCFFHRNTLLIDASQSSAIDAKSKAHPKLFIESPLRLFMEEMLSSAKMETRRIIQRKGVDIDCVEKKVFFDLSEKIAQIFSQDFRITDIVTISSSLRRLTKEIRTPDAICLEILEAMKDICKLWIGSIPPSLYSDPNLGWVMDEVGFYFKLFSKEFACKSHFH
jgi:hypothetical protein